MKKLEFTDLGASWQDVSTFLGFIGDDRLSKSRWQVEGDSCFGTGTVAAEQIKVSWTFYP